MTHPQLDPVTPSPDNDYFTPATPVTTPVVRQPTEPNYGSDNAEQLARQWIAEATHCYNEDNLGKAEAAAAISSAFAELAALAALAQSARDVEELQIRLRDEDRAHAARLQAVQHEHDRALRRRATDGAAERREEETSRQPLPPAQTNAPVEPDPGACPEDCCR